MKNCIFTILIVLFYQNLSSQTISGHILNFENNCIKNARVINLNKKLFSYSDNKGKFIIYYEKGDSLRISHLNYENFNFIYNGNDTIKLKNKTIQLNEVVISSSKKVIKKIKNKKYDSWYALSSSSEYAFKLGSEKFKKYNINDISIPIKKKINTEDFRALMFQVYNYNNITKSIGKPISEVITIKSEELDKIIKLKFNEPIQVDTGYFYLVISNSIQNSNSKISHKSINPYFAIKKGNDKNTFLLRNFVSETWYDSMEYNYPYAPILKCEIEIEI